MRNVLVTSAGQRASLVRAFQVELHQVAPHSKVYTADLDPAMSAACHVSDGAFRLPHATAPDFADRLLDLCLAEQVELVIPTIDTELMILAAVRDRFGEVGVEIAISSVDLVATCRDKRRTNDLFVARGIDIPTPIEKPRPTFPLFIKPYDGSLSADTFVIHSPDELVDRHLTDDRLMFMEYLDPQQFDEYTVDLYYDRRHRLRCAIPRQRLKVRAGEVNKAVTVRNALVPLIADRLAVIDGARGCLTAQFFHHSGTERIVGIEINARFGGGYPLSYHAGGNFPGWLLREYLLDEEIAFFDDWIDALVMLRYDEEVIVGAAGAESRKLCRP